MREIEKINHLIALEMKYGGPINKNDYILCLGLGAYAAISSYNARFEEKIDGVDYRVMDTRDPYYITLIKKDILHSICREIQHQTNKACDFVANRSGR